MKEQHTSFHKSGWWMVLIGIFTLIIFLVDYKIKFILDIANITELSGLITATSGSCFSLAGLFFVIDNLMLQRQSIETQRAALILQQEELKNQVAEMIDSNKYFKQQNEVILSQQYQTTFFKLLEAHTTLINGLEFGGKKGQEGINNLYLNIVSSVITVNEIYKNNTFQHYRKTKENPIYYLLNNKDSINAIFNNIKAMLDFVKNKMSNDSLYYDILYNYLTISEKYILGIYVDCIKDKYSDYFINLEYKFTELYDSNEKKYKLTYSNYFPEVAIMLPTNLNFTNIETLKAVETNGFTFKINKNNDYLQGNLNFKKVYIRLLDSSNEIKNVVCIEQLRVITNGEEHYLYINNDVWRFIDNLSMDIQHTLIFSFITGYFKEDFVLEYKMVIKFTHIVIQQNGVHQEYDRFEMHHFD